MIGIPLNEFEKTVRNANETKCRQHDMPRGFSDVVDWSALLIDLWRHLDGSCPRWVQKLWGRRQRSGTVVVVRKPIEVPP